MEEKVTLKTIGIKPKTFAKLQAKGYKGETWDDLINRLCDDNIAKINNEETKLEKKLERLKEKIKLLDDLKKSEGLL